MAWTKSGATLTAKAGQEDVTMELRRDKPSADWLVTTRIEVNGDDGRTEVISGSDLLSTVVAAGVVTADDADTFVRVARKIRNGRLAALGFVQG
jgi:hypothetical protein